jgi:transporter family protein
MSAGPIAGWVFWALLSAVFAALTAIFAKVGVAGVDSDVATLIRTVVILVTLGTILLVLGKLHTPGPLSAKTWTFLVLSGLATGASWLCYFRALSRGPASLVAPVDKLSVVLVAIFGAVFLAERLGPFQWAGVALVGTGAVLLIVG